jgi:hypothetical protein
VPSKYYSSNYLERPLVNVIEDPVSKKSRESYFIQFADHLAYAANRFINPLDLVNEEFWKCLDKVLIRDVNKIRGGPPGIVKWP